MILIKSTFLLLLASFTAWADKLPAMPIDKNSIFVGGVSAGGAMAIQFHVSYSAGIMGAGLFAAPPYYCANGDIEVATSSCMKDPALIVLDELISATTYAEITALSIDGTGNMKDDRVWILSGTEDTIVKQGVVDVTTKYYQHYVNEGNVRYVNNLPAEHAWITDNFGNNCSYLGSPFINNCKLDGMGELLSFLFPNEKINAPSQKPMGNLSEFEQIHYTAAGVSPLALSLGQTGYLYVPQGCNSTAAPCKLMIAFHGCKQTIEDIGTDFIQHSTILQHADTNRVVVLFPQARRSAEIPYNPEGCFDWWGYAGESYATKYGAQISSIANMVRAIVGSFD